MNYRILGKTGLKVSEIGLGAEWLERHNTEEVKENITFWCGTDTDPVSALCIDTTGSSQCDGRF